MSSAKEPTSSVKQVNQIPPVFKPCKLVMSFEERAAGLRQQSAPHGRKSHKVGVTGLVRFLHVASKQTFQEPQTALDDFSRQRSAPGGHLSGGSTGCVHGALPGARAPRSATGRSCAAATSRPRSDLSEHRPLAAAWKPHFNRTSSAQRQRKAMLFATASDPARPPAPRTLRGRL